ncbi:hypothetical protein GmRootV15_55630 [Variovorax sp. V15]
MRNCIRVRRGGGVLASVDEAVLIKTGVNFDQFDVWELFPEQARVYGLIDDHDRCPHAVSLIQRSKQNA